MGHCTLFSSPGNYGDAERELVVAPRRNDSRENGSIVGRLKDDFTKAVILTDDHDIRPVITELDELAASVPYKPENYGGCMLVFDNAADLQKNLALSIHQQGITGYLPLTSLRTDISRTMNDIGDVIDLSSQFLLVIKRTGARSTDDNLPGDEYGLSWHADKKIVAVRPLSLLGTLIGLDENNHVLTRQPDIEKPYYLPDSCGHAGQGLYVMRGDVVHSIPRSPTPRWAYTLSR